MSCAKRWLITDKGDPHARRIVDHGITFASARKSRGPHYSRQTEGAAQWTRNGQNIVLITADLDAVWAMHRPAPGKATRPDGLDAWENVMFRNTAAHKYKSSELIREAVALCYALWSGGLGGAAPADGVITFIKPLETSAQRAKTSLPGACYRHAGWEDWGESRDGKPRLRAPQPETIEDWRAWDWKRGRGGGKLRCELATIAGEGQGELFAGAAR